MKSSRSSRGTRLLAATVALTIAGCAGSSDTDEPSDTSTVDPLTYHDGYWVLVQAAPDPSGGFTVVNDMHIDLLTRRATVYAQMQAMGEVVSPPQVGPGECTNLLDGSPVCFHPNAVYLNGTGLELDEADGTGEWWVKHSWVVGGEGYRNWELLPPQEDYAEGLWVEGVLLEDGLTMRVGAEEIYNIRLPRIDSDPVLYDVIRFSADTEDFAITLQCSDDTPSAFDGRARPCPAVDP